MEPDEEICVVNEYQRRGTTFPVAIKTNGDYEHTFALMDTGASRSCINYTMFLKTRNPRWSTMSTPRVFTADGSDLGSMGIVQLLLKLGDKEVVQDFVVCRQLKRDVILGADFGKQNCAGIEWTTRRTRVLSLNGIPAVEVEENELGLPVTAAFHVKVPPRHNGVFQVNIHGDTNGTHIISANSQFLEKNPNVYQHEISIITEGTDEAFPLIAVTNLDFAKTLHIGKGEIVGFARPEADEVTYIATAKELNIDPYIDNSPRNWIPPRKRVPLEPRENSQKASGWPIKSERPSDESKRSSTVMINPKELQVIEEGLGRHFDKSQESKSGECIVLRDEVQNRHCTKPKAQHTTSRQIDESEKSTEQRQNSWLDINEVVESDFLISPGDIYPSRKVELKDAEVSEETLQKFEKMCEDQKDAFSKNNRDIGKTQLIEMEIDTGGSVPLAQSPYTLPLKHYDWVRKEIETLEKAGIIERSLSPWASPVIVVPKKSAPDEPPRRRLCVDYRRVNALQQEVKRTDKATGCLTLYPLPKIDEMFAKLGGARVFSTIDLRSAYYHIGLTRESQAKSAFVVPMGKWQFKRTPFGLSQAPAYFQLLIDQVLMGCGDFAMGYLDDIIVYSKTEEDHLHHLEEIFKRMKHFDLKMKREKSSFFKKHIQYLGHLVSEKGFEPLPEKLEAIRKMPHPKSAKEVKQFLGLIGYYRKFIPRFSDLSRPLTRLTRHDCKFDWTPQCQKSFDHLRELLMEYPILRYPDPMKEYTLFTDASGIGWSGVLTQEHEDEKGRLKNHPICYVSGQFRGSQLNWAALTKEAYAIYMSIRRLVFYIADADVTIKCDHLPLKKFLTKQTMNAKVNNWAVELEQFNLKMQWIMGSKNTLADSLSRLLEVCPEAAKQSEPAGQEFGCVCFDELEPVRIEYIEVVETVQITENENFKEIQLPLKNSQMQQLQRHDDFCREIARKLSLNKHMNKLFMMKQGIVYRLWCENSKTEECIVVPEVLRNPLLMLAHNYSGHNGFRRTYNALKRQYYWPGMRKHILKHCKSCHQCSLQNQGPGELEFGHFNVPSVPMEFICMDLVGPITPQTSKGNKYILTVIDMLTGYTIAVAIPDKKAETVCQAYRDHVYCVFGGSSRILTDNGTEFRSKEMKQICSELEIKQVFSPVYTPQANGRLEGWHRFLKSCIAKHIRGMDVEWDDLIPLAVSSYNFFPCQSSKESPFVLMFGRDPITPIAKLLEPKLRFYGEKGVSLRMDTLRKLYTVAAENIRRAREKHPRQDTAAPRFQVNDLVLVKDPDSAVFEPRYLPNYRIIAIHGKNRIEVQDEKGHKSVRRSGHVKPCHPAAKVCHQLPPREVYEQYGRTSKLLIHPKDVPHIPLEVFKEEQEVEKTKNNDTELSSVDSIKEPLVDDHDDSGSRAESETTMEDVTRHQCDSEVCVLELYSEDDDTDTNDESKNRSPRRLTGTGKGEGHESHIDLTKKNSDINITDELTSWLQVGEGNNQAKPSKNSDVNDRYVDNIDTSGNRQGKQKYRVSNGPGGNKEIRQGIGLLTVNPPTLNTDFSEESGRRSNSCYISADQDAHQLTKPVSQNIDVEPITVNLHDNNKCLVRNKRMVTKQQSIQMSNKWLSSAFSMFTSSILRGNSRVKMDNINVESNSIPTLNSDFNFFL